MVIEGCPGLRLVATATRKTWTYRYKAPAAGGAKPLMKQVALGQWPALSVHSAVGKWQALRDERAAGVDPGQQRRDERKARARPEPATHTVRDVVNDYIAGHLVERRKAEGALAARRALEKLLLEEPEFADRPAASITRADAFELLDARKDKPTAAVKLRSMLGSAWDYALDSGRIDGGVANWWRLVMRGRLKSYGRKMGGEHIGIQRRFLRATEIGELLAWSVNMHPLGRDTLQMYLWTCTRGVEILAMRPEHVKKEADGWWWTVPKALTKNARVVEAVDLRVPLVGRALEIVMRRMSAVNKSGLLFEDSRQEQYTQKDFSTYIYHLQPYSDKAQARQGEGLVLPVTNWTPHNLRRTSRTLLAALGCSNEVGEVIVGHLPAEIIGIYNAYSYDAERRLWLGKLAARLEELEKQGQAALPARP